MSLTAEGVPVANDTQCHSYLLSPQTSGVGHPISRINLLGSANPTASSWLFNDPDPIIFSEILEFALSLTTPAKGQEAFPGLPHLQTYRFIRAVTLAELGDVALANRCTYFLLYCVGPLNFRSDIVKLFLLPPAVAVLRLSHRCSWTN
jgi:hypothetical protein